jgi:uncharacterized protein YkwD
MVNKLFLFLLVLTFSQITFSQNAADENTPKAYIFSSGSSKSSAPTRPRAANLSSVGTDSALNLSRIYQSEPTKPAGKLTAATAFDLERLTFELINQQRAKTDVPPLAWCDDAAKIARLHSENMANYNFFSHTGLDGLLVNDRADFFGVKKWQAIGENIAYNQGFENPVEFAVERWMQSPKHRDNLLNSRWKESGIGIAVTANGTYYFTEVFLMRK